MSSFAGAIQRPLVAAAAVAVASFSADKSPFQGSSRDCSTSNWPHSSWVCHVSDSKLGDLSFVSRIPVAVPNVQFRVAASVSDLYRCSVASPSLVQNLYHSSYWPRPAAYPPPRAVSSYSTSEVMYKWHLPHPNALIHSNSSLTTVVVLLGWLGARQKHLNKYAEWYTSRGFHVITFTFPMGDILCYRPGGKAEQNVHLLVDHLAQWLEGETQKNLVFHTFSNTGWLTYGVILEHFQKQDPNIIARIKGCIVDSAPVAYPDPQVWASGFSAAFLKKNSVATKGRVFSDESGIKVSIDSEEDLGLKPAVTEAALLLLLKKFFEVVLDLPSVNRRLSDVMSMLSSKQPSCPQLYMYSSADRVIPADSVESFVESQRRAGHDVRACNFVSSPHVDHFRNDPKLYTSQLSQFLDECVLNRCKSY